MSQIMSVQEQLNILINSNTLNIDFSNPNSYPTQIIFERPQISLQESIIDIHNNIWTNYNGTYYYKNINGSTCPIFFINKWKW